MPTAEATITVSIAEGGTTLGEIEEQVAESVQEAARELLLAACRAMEGEAIGSLRRRRQVAVVKTRPLEVLTRFGWVRLRRQQTVDKGNGQYRYPLDEVLGLAPRQHVPPWVQEQAVALATRVPYWQATRLLAGLVEARLGLSRARHLLLVGDGTGSIEALAGHQRCKATYQLDWWHLTHALRSTFPDRPELGAGRCW